ncbi:polysaccharide deacetylase [Paenibacillus sp. TRM 82003]|nr:polysaccharide deacetylase [Paenibacillus sp. TRM 82003]
MMAGSWSKRTALLTVMTVLFFLWPPAAEEADILAAAPSYPTSSAHGSVQAPAAAESEAPEAAAGEAASVEEVVTEPAAAAGASAEPSDPPPPSSETPQTPEMPEMPEPSASETAIEPERTIDSGEAFRKLSAGDRTGGLGTDEAGYVRPERPTVYLTFDDGPTIWTPQVLDILKEYDVPATFFTLGKLAEERPDMIRRIVSEGHALGNHTYNHKYDELYGTFTNFWEQVERTDDILRDITGQSVRLLRAPGGTATNFDAFYFYYLNKAGYHVHDWTVDSGDSKRRNVPADEIVRNVKRSKLTHEVNVLLHDGAGHEQSVKALPEIIEYYQEQGYEFAVLDERVKPVSFRVSKVKWSRSTDENAFLAMLTTIEAGQAAETLFAAEDRNRAVAVLTVKEGQTPERETWVALRDWAADKGTVVWDASAETAIVEVGETTLRLRVRTGEAVRIDATGTERRVDVAFALQDERIRVLASAADAAAGIR